MEQVEDVWFDVEPERPRMMLGATLDTPEFPIPVNTSYEGLQQYQEPTKKNIIPPFNEIIAYVTRHIYLNDKRCMKVFYTPNDTTGDAKLVWRENEVVIDNAIYTYVEIGDLCWLQQDVNSTLPFPNRRVDQKHCPGAMQSKHTGLRGYLYNPDEAQAVVDSIPGAKWRIPTVDDWNSLRSSLNYPSAKDLIALNEDGSGGTDKYGLGFTLCGYVRVSKSGSLQYSGLAGSFYYQAYFPEGHIPDPETGNRQYKYLNSSTTSSPTVKTSTASTYTYYMPLRLCRDNPGYVKK